MTNSANRLFDNAKERILSDTWKRYPSTASRLGIHDFDGRLPSISQRALATRVNELRRGLAELESIDSSALSIRSYYDHHILMSAIQKELLELTELRWHEHNPMEMLRHIDVSGYIQRNYAPLEQRVEMLTLALLSVPNYLAELRSGMSGRLAAPVLEASIEAYDGIASFYDIDLVNATSALTDTDLRGRLEAARELAAEAVRGFVEHLKALRPYADASFAIGRGKFTAMLKHGEMVDLPLERLLTIGEGDLQRNLERFSEVAAQIVSSRPPADVIASIAADHPAADALVEETHEMLEEIRQFLIDEDIVSIPSEVRCQTVPTPSFMRWAFAALDYPGPFEETATEAYYYVTPVEPHWSDEEKEQWLTSFNYSTLRAVSVHEAYPGHYVHYLHTRNACSMVSRIFGAYSFWEGWAHYAELMMVEAGYLSEPHNELGQLMESLLRNCRFICAIRMHTQGMTVEEATRFFMDNAFMEELPARKEAMRGTFDPMYLNYTLGKLMILKLREDYRRAKGESYTMKGFHDEFLSFGTPPIPLAREMMLGQGSGDIL